MLVKDLTKKLIDAKDIPTTKIKQKTEEWIETINQIPAGKALATTEEEIGYRASSIHLLVSNLKKRKVIPDSIRVRRKTDAKGIHIYIENTAKPRQ